MTDAADNMRSRFGNHIDLSAPGWEVLSTTVNGGYWADSGTSYATPLVAGMAAVLLSINPTLGGEEVMELLKTTARDLGAAGWDQFFGWGRVDFGAAAAAARASVPAITSIVYSNGQAMVATEWKSGVSYELWKSPELARSTWMRVTNAIVSTNSPDVSRVTLTDPVTAEKNFYRIRYIAP
jgi:subtilisin family serine protease